MNCPRCESDSIVKDGYIHNDKQKYKCNRCGRQFVENPTNTPVSEEKKKIIGLLFLERISLAHFSRNWRIN